MGSLRKLGQKMIEMRKLPKQLGKLRKLGKNWAKSTNCNKKLGKLSKLGQKVIKNAEIAERTLQTAQTWKKLPAAQIVPKNRANCAN